MQYTDSVVYGSVCTVYVTVAKYPHAWHTVWIACISLLVSFCFVLLWSWESEFSFIMFITQYFLPRTVQKTETVENESSLEVGKSETVKLWSC